LRLYNKGETMNYLRALRLLVLAAAAVMSFAGIASANAVTSPAGTAYTSTIKAESEGATVLHGSFVSVSCNKSSVEGKVETHSGTTAGGKISSLLFSECNYPVKVLKPGSLEVHATEEGRGTLTSTGAEITIETSVGLCVFTTNATDIGTLTGTTVTGGNATLDIASSLIPRTGGSAFCGASGKWTGSYKVTTPSTLYVGSTVHPVPPLTSPIGAAYTSTIKAESEGTISLHGEFTTVTCKKSSLEGKVESHNSTSASGNLSSLTFGECNYPVKVLETGSLVVHSTGGGNGIITSKGALITIGTSSAPCLFETWNTQIGTIKDSGITGSNAKMEFGGSSFPRIGHSPFCGESGTLTGSYKVTTPSTLYVGHSTGTHPTVVVTSPKGTGYTSTIKAESEGATLLHGSFTTVQCNKSAVEAKVEAHSATTASGKIASLSWSECNSSVKVIKPGSLEIHSLGNGKGTMTSTGAEITIETSVGVCTFTTNATDIGTVTDTTLTAGNATLDIDSSAIPRTGGSFFCGASGEWTGSYKATTPSSLYLD
jgi:hypothetical protein